MLSVLLALAPGFAGAFTGWFFKKNQAVEK